MKYIIINFKSRNTIYIFQKILKQQGIQAQIINSPKQISSSCSLSLKCDFRFFSTIKKLLNFKNYEDFNGLYIVEKFATHINFTKC